MIEKFCGIYYIENKKDNKKYIGYSNNIERRFYEHRHKLKNKSHSNQYLQNVYNKYGLLVLDFYIIEVCKEDALQEREKYYIKKYNTNNKDFGYNLTVGGDGLFGITRTWGNKISNSKKGIKFSKEHIKNLKTSHKGYVPTESQKSKIQIALVGKKKNSNSSSKYVGVSKVKNKWRAYIVINHKQIYLGKYNLEKEAAIIYDKKCWEIYGDISKLNFPEKFVKNKI